MANSQEFFSPPHNNGEILTQRTFNAIYGELEAFGSLPDAFDLRLNPETIALYDRISDNAGSIGEIVGKTHVKVSHQDFIGERIETSVINDPGLLLDREDDESAETRLLGYVAFQKDSERGHFDGYIALLDTKTIEIAASCLLANPMDRDLDHELWKFAHSLGLDQAWLEYVKDHTGSIKEVGHYATERAGRMITKGLRNLRLASRE